MTMIEKYLMKLFTFTLYFIIIYVNVTAVNALIKRELFQKRAEWDPPSIECHDHQDNSKPCDKKDWTEDENYRFTSDIIKTQPNMELDDCFNLCWEDKNCYAVSREKGGNRACIFLGKNYGKENDKKYDSYIPRCCTSKEPPVEPTKEPASEPDLPVIVDNADNCLPGSSDYRPSANGPTLYSVQENKDYNMSPYNSSTGTSTLACQRQCTRDKKCRAVSVESNGNVCHFYDQFVMESSSKNIIRIFYIKFTCQINKSVLLNKKNDLLIVTDYRPYCQKISNTTIQTCSTLIWVFLDETRYDVSGGYVSYNMAHRKNSIQECLNDCLTFHCYGVTIDHVRRTCYRFHALPAKSLTRQSSWSTYKLQCCYGPK